MHDRPVDQRIHDFAEVDAGLTTEEAMAEAERCLQCKKPLCVKGCPVNIDIPSFIREIATGKLQKSGSDHQGTEHAACHLRAGLPSGGPVRGSMHPWKQGYPDCHWNPRTICR